MDHSESSGSMWQKIIFLNILFFVFQQIGGYKFSGMFVLNNGRSFELWRWISYMFLHANFSHILFNMWSFFIFAPMVESNLGSKKFLKLYLFSGIIGAGFWLIFNLKTQFPLHLLGASGALFGVMAAAARLFPDVEISLLFPPIDLKIKTLVMCLALLSVLMVANQSSTIAHLAHLGGLVGGFLFTRKKGFSLKTKKSIHADQSLALHKCSACGITEKMDIDMGFRVCSKCQNGEEYCLDHIHNHQHR